MRPGAAVIASAVLILGCAGPNTVAEPQAAKSLAVGEPVAFLGDGTNFESPTFRLSTGSYRASMDLGPHCAYHMELVATVDGNKILGAEAVTLLAQSADTVTRDKPVAVEIDVGFGRYFLRVNTGNRQDCPWAVSIDSVSMGSRRSPESVPEVVQCSGESQPSTTRVTAPTQVISFEAVSSSVVEVIVNVCNPSTVRLKSVTCIVNAYVSTQNVARFFSGGSIENRLPNESRRVRTSAQIKDSQAAFVQRVEIYCSSPKTMD